MPRHIAKKFLNIRTWHFIRNANDMLKQIRKQETLEETWRFFFRCRKVCFGIIWSEKLPQLDPTMTFPFSHWTTFLHLCCFNLNVQVWQFIPQGGLEDKNKTLWTHITENTEHRIQLWCICWQHKAPNTYIEDLTSHLHAMIRTHNFDFDVRFWPISAFMSNT